MIMHEALRLVVIWVILASAQGLYSLQEKQASGDVDFAPKEGWEPLLSAKEVSGWHGQDGKPLEWFTADDAQWDSRDEDTRLHASPVPGGIILNGPKGHTANLVTDRKFGDVELHLEFLISKGSNSGVYLQGLYEVQIKDSYGVEKPTVHDCGAIYERWKEGKGVGGSAPLKNAARPPGQWQSYTIWFRAPRFDARGGKVENARFVKVLLNGVLVQSNVEIEGPTRASMVIPEAPTNPLMLQGDHGPVAFRRIYIRPLPSSKSK
jgi:hypothetical protein